MKKITIQNKSSELNINLEKGGQIEKLLLTLPNSKKTISVIKPFDENENFFLSGNFLMYPWVNRIENTTIQSAEKKITISPIQQDSNNFAIHGLYFNQKRNKVAVTEHSAEIIPSTFNSFFPEFTETYLLEESSLTIKTTFYNPTSDIQEFAYGYHPYLRLDSKLENCKIHTNLSHYIPLTNELLPNSALEKRNVSELFLTDKPIGNLELDHLLTGKEEELYFGISNENYLLRLRIAANSQLTFPYFQIYTPADKKSIAIEPMTSTGNAFFIKDSGICRLNPKEKKTGEFVIELRAL